jgi:hypothetical protein
MVIKCIKALPNGGHKGEPGGEAVAVVKDYGGGGYRVATYRLSFILG